MSQQALIPSQRDRWNEAERIKEYSKISLPELDDWNYQPCEFHTDPDPACEYQLCGGPLFDHQTTNVAWLYAVKKGILSDEPGCGKTNSILATLCLAKQRGESLRSLLIVPTTSVAQWGSETQRFAPGLNVVSVNAGMTKAQRIAIYSNPFWEVLIIGFHLATRDIEALEHLEPLQLVSDDVDPLLNPKNATHKAINRLSRSAERVIVANATNLQTRLAQLRSASEPIGGATSFHWRNEKNFNERYVQKRRVNVLIGYENDPDRPGHHRPVWQSTLKIVGHQNLNEFKRLYQPMQIRHRYEDLTDLRIPDVVSERIYLELYPAQREKYRELQAGVLTLQKEKDQPPQQKQVSAMTAWLHGAQVCAGLPALGEPDGPDASSKLDWTVNAIRSWNDRKIVVYARNVGTIEALRARLTALEIGFETIWGKDAKTDHRSASIKRFWEDPACQVMILSAAGERSLNLQIAQVVILVDLQLNPARVHQIMGRVRRAGSAHERVFAFTLLAVNTQEDRYQTSLAARQALFDAVHDEDHGEMFERLSPDDLLRLIRP